MQPVDPGMAEEASLEQLAAKFSNSDEESVSVEKTSAQPTSLQPGEPAAAADSLARAATSEASDSDAFPVEDDDDDYFDSEDEELGSALDWADFSEEMGARGGAASTSGSALGGYHPNAGGGAANRAQRAALQPTANNMQRLLARVNTGAVTLRDDVREQFGRHAGSVPSSVATAVRHKTSGKAAGAGGGRGKDRSDRATVEQVLDPRTRMVMFKMLNRGVFDEVNGCVSTGKEANVYHATGKGVEGELQELAIKVYKTAILVFKDRDRYVVGDSRFQRYCKSNPRKMVKMWAEKEMRNLARLHAAGINCPKPLQLRLHVLVMEFLGKNGVAAPRLKDAGLPPPRMRQTYTEMVLMVRALYQKCRLVHADLSEYNVLVHDNQLYCIDVSQAVELDHPRAFDFLREDCLHVNDFFRRNGVATLTVKELFDFAVDPAINDDNLDDALDALMEVAASRPIGLTPEQQVAEAVFHQAFIPKKLEEVVHYERDHARLQQAGAAGGGTGADAGGAAGRVTEGIYYQGIAGMKADMSGARLVPKIVEQAQQAQRTESTGQPGGAPVCVPPEAAGGVPGGGVGPTDSGSGNCGQPGIRPKGRLSEALHPSLGEGRNGGESESAGSSSSSGGTESDSEAGSGSEGEEGGEGWEERRKLSKEELRAARKENKKQVKEGNKEKRKTKLPKHLKKKATKAGKKKR